jgi:hypothetical protein
MNAVLRARAIAVLHARAIDAEFFYDKNVRQRMSRCNP